MKSLENTHTEFMFASHTVEATEVSEHDNPLCDLLITQILAPDVPKSRELRHFSVH